MRSALFRPFRVRSAAVVLAIAAGSACAKSESESGGPPSETGSTAPPPDDFNIELAIPVSLFDEIVLAVERIPSVAGAEAPVATGVSSPESVVELAADVLRVPLSLLGQVSAAAGVVRDIVAATFGPGGPFPNGQIVVPRGGSKVMTLTAAAPTDPRFLRVSHRVGHAYEALLEYFVAAKDGDGFVANMTVEISGPGSSRVTRRDESGGATPTTTEITYAGASQSGSVIVARAEPTASGPAVVAMDFGQIDRGVTRYAAGAYTWKLAEAVADARLAPRFAQLRSGDVEIFRVVTSVAVPALGAAGVAAQELAFVPVDAAPDRAPVIAERIADSTYARFVREYGAAIIQDIGLNPACGTSGKTIRDAFPAAERPAEIEALPDDLCLGDAAKDATVWRAVQRACTLTSFVVAGIQVVDASGQSASASVDVCRIVAVEGHLANPQYFTRADEGYVFLKGAEAPTERHTEVAARLAQVPWPTRVDLVSFAFPPATQATATELGL